MTIAKLKQLDERKLLTSDQYHKLKSALHGVELEDNIIKGLINFIGVANGTNEQTASS